MSWNAVHLPLDTIHIHNNTNLCRSNGRFTLRRSILWKVKPYGTSTLWQVNPMAGQPLEGSYSEYTITIVHSGKTARYIKRDAEWKLFQTCEKALSQHILNPLRYIDARCKGMQTAMCYTAVKTSVWGGHTARLQECKGDSLQIFRNLKRAHRTPMWGNMTRKGIRATAWVMT